MVSASDLTATPRRYACSKSSTCAPSPIRQRPMARLSASSKPHCANGPTLGLTRHPTTEPNIAAVASEIQLVQEHRSLKSKPPISRLGLTEDRYSSVITLAVDQFT